MNTQTFIADSLLTYRQADLYQSAAEARLARCTVLSNRDGSTSRIASSLSAVRSRLGAAVRRGNRNASLASSN